MNSLRGEDRERRGLGEEVVIQQNQEEESQQRGREGGGEPGQAVVPKGRSEMLSGNQRRYRLRVVCSELYLEGC